MLQQNSLFFAGTSQWKTNETKVLLSKMHHKIKKHTEQQRLNPKPPHSKMENRALQN